MSTRRASQLTIGYSSVWKRQSAWDVPLGNADVDRAFPATSRNYLDTDETVEDVYDCTNEDFLFEIVTAQFARLNIDFDVDPDVLAGVAAFAYGVAAAPTGGSNEVQTETITATGGTRRLSVQVGANAQTTTDIPFNAGASDIQTALEVLSNVAPSDIIVSEAGNVNEVQTETVTATGGTRTLTFKGQTTTALAFDALAATIQTALEALSNVEPGDITVAGTGPYTYTFGGQYANSDVPLIVVGTGSLTGGTSSIVETTPGAVGTRVYTFSGTNFQKQDVAAIAINTFGLTGGSSTIAETTPGVGLTHAISRLTGYTLPLMTFYIGFRGSDKQPLIFKNVVVDQFRVRSASREKVTCSVQLIGSADLQYAVGYTMPDCTDILPLRFGDCFVSVGGTDYVASNAAREFEYYFQNDVTPKFDGSGIYSTRHERADKRPSGMNLFLLGEPGDTLYNLAKARTTLPVYIQCGPAGRHIKFNAPQAIVKLAPTSIRFGQDPPESEMAIVARPKKVSGDATTPTTVEAVISTQATLLTSA